MDKYYLSDVIRRIEQEKAVHDEKFAGNELHANCLPRFDNAIEKLRLELSKLEDAAKSE